MKKRVKKLFAVFSVFLLVSIILSFAVSASLIDSIKNFFSEKVFLSSPNKANLKVVVNWFDGTSTFKRLGGINVVIGSQSGAGEFKGTTSVKGEIGAVEFKKIPNHMYNIVIDDKRYNKKESTADLRTANAIPPVTLVLEKNPYLSIIAKDGKKNIALKNIPVEVYNYDTKEFYFKGVSDEHGLFRLKEEGEDTGPEINNYLIKINPAGNEKYNAIYSSISEDLLCTVIYTIIPTISCSGSDDVKDILGGANNDISEGIQAELHVRNYLTINLKDDANKPLSGINILADDTSTASAENSKVKETSTKGTYQLYDVQSGKEYALKINPQGTDNTPAYASKDDSVTISKKSETIKEIKLKKLPFLVVQVVDKTAGNAPIKGIAVELLFPIPRAVIDESVTSNGQIKCIAPSGSPRANSIERLKTNANGEAEFIGLSSERKYSILANLPPYPEENIISCSSDVNLNYDSGKLESQQASKKVKIIKLDRNYHRWVRVVDSRNNNPIAEANLELKLASPEAGDASIVERAETDADGMYYFKGLKYRELKLAVTKTQYVTPEAVIIRAGELLNDKDILEIALEPGIQPPALPEAPCVVCNTNYQTTIEGVQYTLTKVPEGDRCVWETPEAELVYMKDLGFSMLTLLTMETAWVKESAGECPAIGTYSKTYGIYGPDSITITAV